MSGAQQEAPVRYRYYAAAPGALTSPWLVVGGFGVAVENMGAPTLWQGMKKAAGGYVANPDAPFNSLRDCQDMADTFRGAVLRRTLRHWATDGETLKHFVENYPIPTCVSLPGRKERSVEFQVLANESNRRVQYALQNIAGMAFHEIGHIDTRATHVDLQLAWRTVMSRFDGAGDLNCQLLYAEDGYAMRSRPGGWEPPQPVGPRGVLARPKSASDLSESFASVLLMRPAAAQWLAELAPHTIDSRPVKTLSNGMRIVGRHGFGGIHNETVWFGRNGYRPPHSYLQSSHYVPAPWSQAQMAQYSAMPTYGWLYRPHLVDHSDAADTQAQVSPEQKQQRLQEGIRTLVNSAFEGAAPTRVFYLTGNDEQAAQRNMLIQQAMAQALPDLQLLDSSVGYNLSQRLGDLGATGSLVALGLAAFCSWEEGGNSLIVDVRGDAGATLLAFKSASREDWQRYRRAPFDDI